MCDKARSKPSRRYTKDFPLHATVEPPAYIPLQAGVGKCTDCSTFTGKAWFQKTQCLYQLDKVSDQENHNSKGREPGWDAVGAAVGEGDKGYWRSSTAGALLLARNCCCIPGNHSLSFSWACHILFHLLVPFQGVRLICLLGFAVYLHLFSA